MHICVPRLQYTTHGVRQLDFAFPLLVTAIESARLT